MYTGTKEANTNNNYLKTGLSTFTFLGVNPNAAQIKEWTGRELTAEPMYDIQKDLNDNDVRPVHIYLRNPDGIVTNFRLNVGSVDAIAKSGNYQVCTSTGSVVWAKQGGEVKSEFADHKALKIGEADLIQFIQRLTNFDTNSGENFYAQAEKLNQDAKSLFAGNYQGMNNLAKWTQDNDKTIVMVFTVREKKTTDENGNDVVKMYQAVSSEPKTWFHGTTSKWIEDKLKERYEKSLQVSPGQTQAYPIIKDFFTYVYQDFKKEDCVNSVPDNSANTKW